MILQLKKWPNSEQYGVFTALRRTQTLELAEALPEE